MLNENNYINPIGSRFDNILMGLMMDVIDINLPLVGHLRYICVFFTLRKKTPSKTQLFAFLKLNLKKTH